MRNMRLQLAIEAAQAAGALLKSGFGKVCTIQNKEGRHNLVTEYDVRCEKLIIEFLKAKDPNASILAEESGRSTDSSDHLWIIDPLDGTVNFAHKIPFFCVSIAYAEGCDVKLGVIYNPITDELFTAEKGKGAFFNGQRLQVTQNTSLEEAMTATGFPYCTNENPQGCIDHFANFCHQGLPIRLLGSAALHLAYVASGRLDAFWEVLLNAWDYAAGMLMVTEAGGMATRYNGAPLNDWQEGNVLATNKHLHTYFQESLR